jgi:hypothetical protein
LPAELAVNERDNHLRHCQRRAGMMLGLLLARAASMYARR